MSRNGQPEDDTTMRAVLAALDGGQAARPGAEANDPAVARAAPHLRIVPSGPDSAAPDPATPDPATPEPPAPDRAGAPRRPTIRDGKRDGARDGAHDGERNGDRTPRPEGPGATGFAADSASDRGADAMVAGLIGADGGTPGPDALGAPDGPGIGRRLAAEWVRWRPLRPFVVATLAPVPFLLLAGGFGGVFSLLALLWMTGVLYAIDEVLRRRGVEGPGPLASGMADRLSALLAILHFGLLFFAVWRLSGAAGFGVFSWLATLLAFGLWFGQVSNANAHELIHRGDPRLFRLGMWVYISMLYGHHTSAHRLVHHRFVATTDDPSTAAEGEGFWLFATRAWPGAFVAGYEMEEHRRARRHARRAGGIRGLNPYAIYLAGGLGVAAVMLVLFGFGGLVAYLLLCAHAQVQMLLADYVQHYGLLRRKLLSGALEPAGARHSWDAPHPFSGLMMLNAPRHADHHAHPARPWPELRLSPGGEAPLLPYSLPVMATIALVPPVWHRVMGRRLAKARRAA